MKALKHVGRITKNNAKVLVAFRTLPGESNMALVIPVSQLSDSYHDSIMKVVESDQGQDAFELGETLFIRNFPDGKPMLRALQADNLMVKVPTDSITMTPTPNDEITLHTLNSLIAEQRNCAVDDLCKFVTGAPSSSAEVEELVKVKDLAPPAEEKPAVLQAKGNEALSDKDIAKGLRSQADALYKEAARLRKEAEELDPTVKKSTKVKEEVSA